MNLVMWLRQEIDRRGWTSADLTSKAQLNLSEVEAILDGQIEPDLAFCCGVAQALEKQPARILHLAGHLSDTGLKLALELASGREFAPGAVWQATRQLSSDERRALLACVQRQPDLKRYYNEIRILPHEFNKSERTQDRYRFAVIIISLVLLITVISVIVGVILS